MSGGSFTPTWYEYGPMELASNSTSVVVSFTATSAVATAEIQNADQQRIGQSGSTINLEAGAQTSVYVVVTAEDSLVQATYTVTVLVPMASCSSSQLSEWSDWSNCAVTCGTDVSSVWRTRSVINPAQCSAVLTERKTIRCSSIACNVQVVGEAAFLGISTAQVNKVDSNNGRQLLHDAISAAIAATAGVSFDQVHLLSVTAGSRRALSVKVQFTISIRSSSSANTALQSLTSATTNGVLAETFAIEAANRDKIVDVVAYLLSTNLNEDMSLIAVVSNDDNSEVMQWQYFLLLGINMCPVLIFVFWVIMHCRSVERKDKVFPTVEISVEAPSVVTDHDAEKLDADKGDMKMQGAVEFFKEAALHSGWVTPGAAARCSAHSIFNLV